MAKPPETVPGQARPGLLSSSCLSPFWHAIVFASCSTTNTQTHTCTHTQTLPINAIKYQNLSTHCASIRSAQLHSAWLRLALLSSFWFIPFHSIAFGAQTELNCTDRCAVHFHIKLESFSCDRHTSSVTIDEATAELQQRLRTNSSLKDCIDKTTATTTTKG